MTKEGENKFHSTGIKFLEQKFIPTTEVQTEVEKQKELEGEKPEQINKTDIERATKKESWSTVRSTGDVQIGDIVGIGPKKREELADSGFWSTSDVYKAWKEGNVGEIILAFKGVPNKRDVIASTILSAPEASTRLTKQEILDSLPKDMPTKGTTFLDRRENEIREYLGKIKVDGKVPVKVTIQDEGERLTQEKAEEIMEPSTQPSPVPIILTESKIIRGVQAQKSKARDKIFERGLRDAMSGVDAKKIETMTAFKLFFDTLKDRNPKFQTDAKAFKSAKSAFIKGTIDGFKKDGIFIVDPDLNILRPSDVEIARAILSDKKSQVVIGQTNNFQIPTLKDSAGNPITVLLPSSKIKEAKPGQLVFQSARSNSVEPIRLTGHMSIESPKDIDNLIKVLGANPKNGFIPKGYEHVDDIVKQLMNTFSVVVSYPPKLSINVPRVSEVKKLKDRYVIRIKKGDDAWEHAPVNLWVTENGEMADLYEIAKADELDKIAKSNFDKPFKGLSTEEKASLAIDPDLLPTIWGYKHEYGGSLCEVSPRSSTLYQRLSALKDDIESLTSIEKARPAGVERTPVTVVNPQKKEIIDQVDKSLDSLIDGIKFAHPLDKTTAAIDASSEIDKIKKLLGKDEVLQDAIKEKKGEIVDLIDKKLLEILKSAEGDIGTFNKYAVPNCLQTPPASKDKITIKTGADSNYVATKLDKAIAKCNALTGDAKEKCFVDNVKVTQNLSDVVESRIYAAINKSKNADDRQREKDDVKTLSSIEHKIRTGHFKEEFVDGKLQEINPTRSEKRQALNRAKLLGKMPLDTAKWKFLSSM